MVIAFSLLELVVSEKTKSKTEMVSTGRAYDLTNTCISLRMSHFSRQIKKHRRFIPSKKQGHRRLVRSRKERHTCLLVKGLRLRTRKHHVSQYFNSFADNRKVSVVEFNSRADLFYTRTCTVTMPSSVAEKVLRKIKHKLDGIKVIVEKYRGISVCQEYTRGAHKLKITELTGKINAYKLNIVLEHIFCKCGEYSMISYSDDKPLVAEVDFYNREHEIWFQENSAAWLI